MERLSSEFVREGLLVAFVNDGMRSDATPAASFSDRTEKEKG